MEISRNEKVLNKINRDGQGIEIGASFGPIAPKKEGFKTHVIDHLDKTGLIEKYTSHGMPVENIEEVDFIWKGESYAELTGKKNHYDWIIASHLIEHTPDLIKFINSCQEVLNDDGILSLVIPDARFCFDRFRPLTGISKVIDAHLQENILHTTGTVTENALNTVRKNDSLTWDEISAAQKDSYKMLCSPEETEKSITDVSKGKYVDSHCWCFTPNSFRLLIHDLNTLGYIEMKEVAFFPTVTCEFYISLSKSGKLSEINRLDYLKTIDEERWANINFSAFVKKRLSDRTHYLRMRLKNSLEYRWSLLTKKIAK